MLWRGKNTFNNKKDDALSSSLLPGNAEAKNNNNDTSSSLPTKDPSHVGLWNRTVKRMRQGKNETHPILPVTNTHTATSNVSTYYRQGSNGSISSSSKGRQGSKNTMPSHYYPGRRSRTRPGTSPCNNFLLGGTYYPGKDNRRRINHIRLRRQALWYRIFFSSFIRVCFTVIFMLFVFRRLSTSLLTRTTNSNHNAKEGIIHSQIKRGATTTTTATTAVTIPNTTIEINMPLKDSQLVKEVLQSIESVKEKIAKYQSKHHKHDSSSSNKRLISKAKLDAIQKIDSVWSHRNDRSTNINEFQISNNKVDGINLNHEQQLSKTSISDQSNESYHQKSKKSKHPQYKYIHRLEGDILDKPPRTLQHAKTSRSCPPITNNTEISVTLIIQSTPDRLWLLKETCQRWLDPIIIVVYNNTAISSSTSSSWETLLPWETHCPQAKLLSVQPTPKSQSWDYYPVNKLRNIGLEAIQTTHFLVVDVDFVPSKSLSSIIRQNIQTVVLHNNNDNHHHHENQNALEALVVPAFQREGPPPCQNSHDCQSFWNENDTFLPSSFDDLKHCILKDRKCTVFQYHDNIEGHISTNSTRWLHRIWYEDAVVEDKKNDSPSSVAQKNIPISIQCFHTYRYEPYLVLQWCPDHTPYYDERFHGYGKNKIQYVSHLRFLGYKFRILPEGFIIHFPHEESEVKKIWNDVDANDLHLNMDRLYPEFLRELKEIYGSPSIPTCKGRN